MFVFRHLSLGAVLLALACSLSQAQDPNAGDPVIAEARKAAAVFVDSLPKYLVKRTTTRSENTRLIRQAVHHRRRGRTHLPAMATTAKRST